MDRYVLPGDTHSVLEAALASCCNPGLLFERYVPLIEGKEEHKRRLKTSALEAVRRRSRQDADLMAAHLARWRAQAADLGAKPFAATTQWRFVTGLGRKGALEVGFHFHPLYGFPVLPGSGLKGLARSWALVGAKLGEGHPDLVAVFGRAPRSGEPETAARMGGAIFLDAVPEEPIELDIDVINPHYPDYYRPGKRQAPTNWQNPVPVFFLTIPPGARFHFAVGWRGAPNPKAHALAVDWLKAALQELGAGAKTSAGYGYWDVLGDSR